MQFIYLENNYLDLFTIQLLINLNFFKNMIYPNLNNHQIQIYLFIHVIYFNRFGFSFPFY